MNDCHKGFSLVELIIVIAIMGVLLTVVAPLYLNYLGKSQLAVCRENRDRIKKDMYNELIAFGKNDMEASAYLDEYMEKGGFKKVSTNTYEGICSTNGTVTFEIDGIDSVEAINISAKCSVHGGDEVVVTEPEKQETGAHAYSPTIYKSDGGSAHPSGGYGGNQGYYINSERYKDMSESEIAKQYPYVSIGGFAAGKKNSKYEYFNAQIDMVQEISEVPGSGINNLLQKLRNNIIKYYEDNPTQNKPNRDNPEITPLISDLASFDNFTDFTYETNKDFLRSIIVATEIQIPLGELYSSVISKEIKKGSIVPVRQYLYVAVCGIPNSAFLKKFNGDAVVMVGYRDTEVVVGANIEKDNVPTMQALLNKGSEGTTISNSASVLNIDMLASTELKRTDNWIMMDDVEVPLK